MKIIFTLKKFILALMLVLSTTAIFATHGQGGDITYEYVSNNVYKVRLTLFRDCHGINFDPSYEINIKSASGGFSQNYTLTATGSVLDITPLCSSQTSHCTDASSPNDGVQQYVFENTITLPESRADYIISYSLCCRNDSITTLDGASNQSIYLEATLNSFIANSSPVFNNSPIAFVCSGQQINYNHGVSDADGDELVFTLTAPLQAPATPVTYLAGFSASQPLNTTGAFTMDVTTGAITYVPNGVQTAVVGVKVEEFRLVGGIRTKIGEVLRDMQFSIEDCSVASGGGTANNAAPIVSGVNGTADMTGVTGSYTVAAAAGVPVSFSLEAYDAVSSNLDLTWNNGISVATFTPNGTGTAANFSWTPTINDGGTKFFTVTVKDDNCPILGINVYTFKIIVSVPVSITCPGAINESVASCSKQVTYTSSATGSPAPTVTYSFSGATTGSGNGDGSGSFFNIGTTTVELTATDGGGLTDTCSFDITINEEAVTFTAPNDLCTNAGVQTGLSGGLPAGGVYSGPGVTDDGNGMTYSFDPATAGVGVHTITYTACTNNATDNVEVSAAPSAPVVDVISVYITGDGCAVASGFYNFRGILNGKNSYLMNEYSVAVSFNGVKWVFHTITDINVTGFENLTVPAGLTPPLTGWDVVSSGCVNGTFEIQLGAHLCEGATVSDLAQITTAPNLKFYTVATNGTALNATDVLVSGDYYVSTTAQNGCESDRTMFSLTIDPLPTAPTISSSTTELCSNGSVTLTSSEATGNLWSTGARTQSIVVTSAGDYSVVQVTAGCSSSASNTITITDAPAIDDTVSENTTGILSANESGATYQWYECPNTVLTGETNQDFTPTTVGDYKVEITVGSCVVESACYTVTTLGTVSFDELNFKYYPNPTASILNIEYSKNIQSVSVMNLIGQQLFENKTNNQNVQVDLSLLQVGTYFVKVKSEGEVKIIKVVKQ